MNKRLPANPTAFTVTVPDEALAELRQKLLLARLPQEPDGAAWSMGSNRDYMAVLLQHWLHRFDWRLWEKRLNGFLNYRVALPRRDAPKGEDEQSLHFLIEPGSGETPRPLLLLHGWPGSVLEFVDVIERLAHPERFGGRVEDAFTVICPSLPGFGFSVPLRKPMPPRQIAALFRDLMVETLGCERFFVQAGDWGSIIASWMGIDHAAHISALHLNMVPLRPPLSKEGPPLSNAEKEWILRTKKLHAREGGYFEIQSTKPQTLGYGLSDSPLGLAGWFIEKFHGFTRAPAEQPPPFEMDWLLANITLYWLTDTATTSTWLYWAAVQAGELAMKPGQFVQPPTGFLLPPWDLVPPPPKGWLERGYRVTARRDLERGGHFVALEQPLEFTADVQSFFRMQKL